MRAARARSSVSGVVSEINFGDLPVSCFTGDGFRNAGYGFEGGDGPNIVTGENKKTFVRLVIPKYFEVAF